MSEIDSIVELDAEANKYLYRYSKIEVKMMKRRSKHKQT